MTYKIAVNQETTFTITHTKLYIQVLTLSTNDSAKFLMLLKSDFKRLLTGTNINQK